MTLIRSETKLTGRHGDARMSEKSELSRTILVLNPHEDRRRQVQLSLVDRLQEKASRAGKDGSSLWSSSGIFLARY